MFRWIDRIGIWHSDRNRVDEYLCIYSHIRAVLIREKSAALFLYGEAMFNAVNNRSIALGLSATDILTRDELTLREISNLDAGLEKIDLLTIEPVKPNQRNAEITARIERTCEMILTVYCGVIAIKSTSAGRAGAAATACSDLYMELISDLYQIGSGAGDGEVLRSRLRSRLQGHGASGHP